MIRSAPFPPEVPLSSPRSSGLKSPASEIDREQDVPRVDVSPVVVRKTGPDCIVIDSDEAEVDGAGSDAAETIRASRSLHG